MKIYSSLLLLSFVQLMSAQQPVPNRNIEKLPDPTRQSSDDTVFNITEVKPEFPGGQDKFFKFIAANFVIPEDAAEFVKVFVSFIVEKDGSLTNIKVLRDTGYGTGKEAVRVLKSSPKWKPGVNDGKPVRCSYTIPISIVNRKEAKSDDNTIYNTAGVDVMPTFPGGIAAFNKFVADNFAVPSGSDLTGKIFVTFIVEKDGALTDIKIIRDLGFGTNVETLRVLKLSPKWNPGEKNYKLVRVLYSLPISIGSK